MPGWLEALGLTLSIALGLGSIGCTATCIRDSDCLGHSVCSENRCILVVGRDGGTRRNDSDDGSGGSDADSSGGASGSEGLPSRGDAGD